jgi:NADPH:quinone reductase-like Zn-dependent oxidoreductase
VGLDFTLMKRKSLTPHRELMFARSIFQIDDMIEQNKLLNRIPALLDSGQLQTTMTQSLSAINAENLRKAHVMQQNGSAIGKTVLEEFARPGRTKYT